MPGALPRSPRRARCRRWQQMVELAHDVHGNHAVASRVLGLHGLQRHVEEDGDDGPLPVAGAGEKPGPDVWKHVGAVHQDRQVAGEAGVQEQVLDLGGDGGGGLVGLGVGGQAAVGVQAQPPAVRVAGGEGGLAAARGADQGAEGCRGRSAGPSDVGAFQLGRRNTGSWRGSARVRRLLRPGGTSRCAGGGPRRAGRIPR